VDVVRRRAVVRGLVQGVFFRDSTRREAAARGLAGSAVNRPDGTVEVVVEGPADGVEALVAWLRRGTPQSRVEAVDVTEEQPEGLTGFRVG
jgi:acylphosphatase